MSDFNFWKATPLPNRGDDNLFVAIVTAQDGKQLIAQCTTLDFAKDIEDKHNRFDVELSELPQLHAKAERLDQLQEGMSEMRAAIETEFNSTVEAQKNNIKQLLELIERQFDDIAQLRAQAAELDAARTALEQARPLIEIVKARTGFDAEYNAACAWLAAHAPQAEQEQGK